MSWTGWDAAHEMVDLGGHMTELKPIVILGTGRCGSTFLQTTLCGASNIWI